MRHERKISLSVPDTGEDELKALCEPLETGWLTQGPKVAAFEAVFAKRHSVKYSLAVTSCTTALHLILAGMGVGPGDEVIVPAFTWVATANAVMYCGAIPIFTDVDPRTFNIDPTQIFEKITERTKAIIIVHLFGLCADVDAIRSVVPPHVKIVEDAACAAGAEYKGKVAGGLADAAAFSFHPRKTITTGEGGMVTTNDSALAEAMAILRNHGSSIPTERIGQSSRPYDMPDVNVLGFNYRMTDLQGAVGVVQLSKLDRFIAERKNIADYYRRATTDLDWLISPGEPVNGSHSWQSYVVSICPEKAPLTRDEIMDQLEAKGIATRPGTHAVHMLGYYRERFSLLPESMPGARDCDHNTIALPLHNKLQPGDMEFVVECLKKIQ